jgi:peptide subunit release factor 1 (eRF1)
MAVTVSWDGLRELAAFTAEHGCAISLYLDLDPSVSPTAGDAATRVNALLDEGMREAAASGRNLTHEARQALQNDLGRVRRYLNEEFERDGSRALALFSAGLDNVWKAIPLIDSVSDAIKIGREFYLAPLVPLVGRGDGALVAVVGREQGQLFRLQGGRLRSLADRSEEQHGRHDQGGWSQSGYQRHIEELVGRHLREVADELDRHVRRLRSPRVVIVSSEQTKAELDDLLSNATRGALAGWTQAEAHASPAELLAAVQPVLEQWRQAQEKQFLDRWREERGRAGRAAAGWSETLEAASDGRVEVLLFEEGAEHQAYVCPECGRASVDGGSCPLDGMDMEAEPNGLDLAVHQTLRHGGTVWALQHHDDLAPVENIGALLRY